MSGLNIAGLTNLLGYTVAIALYLMLLVMVLKHPAQSTTQGQHTQTSFYSAWSNNALLLLTAVLGVLWNIGALAIYGLKGIGYENSYPIIAAISFTALGFLPAVVVHSVLRGHAAASPRLARILAIAAYSLSASAGALQFYDASIFGVSPSLWALRLLTFGYVALLTILFISTRRQEGWKKVIWASALAVFAVSALHLSHHQGAGTDSWFVEITGHHASLPLVLAILYEDYRFAFADIFLKQALSLLILVAVAFGLYLGVATPVLAGRNSTDPTFVGLLLGLWVATALLYPWLSRAVAQFVDTIVLRRVHYETVRAEVAQILNTSETTQKIMDEVRDVVARAVSARAVHWLETELPEVANDTQTFSLRTDSQTSADRYVRLLEGSGSKGASVLVPTAESPYFKFEIGTLAGGRRLLSDDIGMLESVAIMVARRIDALRVTHERCEQNLREQEINKLATEAQLRALRAQVNPHFLFNALTTIGYLIQTAPDRALETLMKLTSLLRGVLRTDEVVTLQEELDLIGSYLDIERARFEERLRVAIEVPDKLRSLKVPPLIIQPLVENAIKHGITPARLGGEVRIKARLEHASDGTQILNINVSDSGIGVSELDLIRNRRRGLGLSNIEERLQWYGGEASSLRIESQPGEGTTVEVRLPLLERTADGVFPASSTAMRERRKA